MPFDQFVWLPYLDRGLVPSDLWRPEEMITHIGRRSMLVMWRSGSSRDNILGMALFYLLRIYHHHEIITLDGIGISRESTSAIQHVFLDIHVAEVDDMTTGVLEGPPSSPTQYASVMRKVQTIIRRCMVFISGTLGCTPSQHNIQQTFAVQPSLYHTQELVPKRGAHGVKRDACRLFGGGTYGGRIPTPPHPGG
ncbi:hypothetical protein M9H77_04431 [Catharanthus roseus]|uniref:Uncharacterized protein n=1 Tax=Catharanthus roseus TaxID=4058 RepID=A0ACC0CEL6_CATRO|nr:hypothetical protein M9H77_04431 [Catharanthus roseus]